MPENFGEFLGPSPSGPRAFHGAHTEDLFEGVLSDVLMFSVGFSCMKNHEKTGRTSLNGGSSEMKDAKNHAEMLIASLPFFVECKTKNFWTDMFDHFFSRKSHFPTQPLLAGIFADVPRWRVRHTRGATIHKGGGGSWTKNFQGVFGIPSLKLTFRP